MTKYIRVPSSKVITRDIEAADEIVEILKGNVSKAIEANDAKAAMAYTMVLSTFCVVIDDLQRLCDMLDDAGEILDNVEATVELDEVQ